MTIEAIERMEVGQLVDFVIMYNDIHDPDKETKPKGTRRIAKQGDWDAFLG